MEDRVVVTGMGAITPLGLDVESTWDNILHGKSGVGPITQFDATDYGVKIAAEVKNFNVEDYISSRDARRLDRYEHFAIAAAQQALKQSGFEITEENSSRVGIVVSSAIGGLNSIQDGCFTIINQGPRRVGPFVIPMMMPNGAAGNISIMYGAHGPSYSIASACASGTDALGLAWMLIKTGIVDTVIAGAAESTITELALAAFDRLGALSKRNDDYSFTPQPFDVNRDGLVMGEGAAILVLEREALAKARRAEILGELAGHSSTADAFHITAPAEDGSGGAAAMRFAMQAAKVTPADVDYINAHGTATDLNDVMETRAIKSAFGERAYDIPVSSTKSMTGHMMGATGALEAVFCLLAMRDSVLPPTAHLQNQDPECDLDYVPNAARQKNIDIAVSNSFGFGGHNGVIVLRKYR